MSILSKTEKNVLIRIENDQLKDIACAKKQKMNKKVNHQNLIPLHRRAAKNKSIALFRKKLSQREEYSWLNLITPVISQKILSNSPSALVVTRHDP
jgi:hypothetical protein